MAPADLAKALDVEAIKNMKLYVEAIWQPGVGVKRWKIREIQSHSRSSVKVYGKGKQSGMVCTKKILTEEDSQRRTEKYKRLSWEW